MLTADMIHMLSDGIRHIICLQPFGCISNHITGRGVEKGLKRLYPRLNLLSLDMDAGTSEVNMLNSFGEIVLIKCYHFTIKQLPAGAVVKRYYKRVIYGVCDYTDHNFLER